MAIAKRCDADNIESNVENIATDTERAAEELTTAHKYQKKAGRRMLFLLLVFGFVLAIIILAVCHSIRSVACIRY